MGAPNPPRTSARAAPKCRGLARATGCGPCPEGMVDAATTVYSLAATLLSGLRTSVVPGGAGTVAACGAAPLLIGTILEKQLPAPRSLAQRKTAAVGPVHQVDDRRRCTCNQRIDRIHRSDNMSDSTTVSEVNLPGHREAASEVIDVLHAVARQSGVRCRRAQHSQRMVTGRLELLHVDIVGNVFGYSRRFPVRPLLQICSGGDQVDVATSLLMHRVDHVEREVIT